MPLDTTLADIAVRLRQGRFPNEQSISQGIVLRVLQELDLPAEQGSYDDRRVYRLDFFERPPAEAAETLPRYLTRARVESGEALEAARKEYRSRNRRSPARAAIPEAWRELVEKGDELLVDLLAGAVESKAGVRPDADDVAEFLAGLGPSGHRRSDARPCARAHPPGFPPPRRHPVRLPKPPAVGDSCCAAKPTPTLTPRTPW